MLPREPGIFGGYIHPARRRVRRAPGDQRRRASQPLTLRCSGRSSRSRSSAKSVTARRPRFARRAISRRSKSPNRGSPTGRCDFRVSDGQAGPGAGARQRHRRRACDRRLSREAHQPAGVQPQRGRALPAAGERYSGLYGEADPAPGGHRAGRGDRRRHGRSNARICRLQRPGLRVQGTWPLGRIAARAIVRTDRAGRPDHARGLLDLGLQGAAHGPVRARLPLGLRRPDHRRQLHLFVGAAFDRRRHRLSGADAAGHARGRLSVRPPPIAHAARLGGHGFRQPGRRSQPCRSDPRPASRGIRAACRGRGRARSGLHAWSSRTGG